MDPNTAIKKYYVGFVVLMVLLISVLGYTVVKAGYAKTDRATNKGVEKIYNKLGYGSTVPESLGAAGISGLPDTIKYTKLSSEQYKICINYKEPSGMFDAGWTSLFGGYFGSGASDYNTGANSSYFDSSVEYQHKKGENCQTITPYSDSSYSSSTYNSSNPISSPGYSSGSSYSSSCSSPSANLRVSGDIVVNRVDTANKTIFFQAYGQYLYDGSTGRPVPEMTSEKYDSNTIICDGNTLTETDISAVKPGDDIMIYLTATSDTTIGQLITANTPTLSN